MSFTQYGTTTNFVVSYDGWLANGPTLAQSVMNYCEYDLRRLSILFGNILPANLPISINISDAEGGGSNNGLDAITCNVNSTEMFNQFGLAPIVVAELAEIFMVSQNMGWNPGYSNGEGLSRVSAQLLYPTDASSFSVADSWYNAANLPSLPDWVDNTEPTDQDFVSFGCATLFLNYLAYQLNYKWTDIIAAVAPASTLAKTAGQLGVPAPVYADFVSLLNNYFPGGNLPLETDLAFTDDVFPVGPKLLTPELYMRHNFADIGNSHAYPLSVSPDIIVKNNEVSNPQVTYSTPASIANDMLSDTDVLTGQANYVYLRVWNRGQDATNVFATIYWSPVATLPTPGMWNLIGDAYYPDVPPGSLVQVSNPGVVWPADQIPTPGHYCFIATVGNNNQPAPNPTSFGSFEDFENYILANNNITWRNFNVVAPPPGQMKRRWGQFLELPFLITGAWDQPVNFTFETEAYLPEGSMMALQVAEKIGKNFYPVHAKTEALIDTDTDPDNINRVRIPLHTNRTFSLGEIELHKATASPSHLLIHIPYELHDKTYEISIRQRRNGKELGRITWKLLPPERK